MRQSVKKMESRRGNRTYEQPVSLPFLWEFQGEKLSVRPAVYSPNAQFPLLRPLSLSCSVHFSKNKTLNSSDDRRRCCKVVTWPSGSLFGSACYVPLLVRTKDGTWYRVADQHLLTWTHLYPYPSQQTSSGTHLCHPLHSGWVHSAPPGVLDARECQRGYLCLWLRCYDYRPISNCYKSQREEGYLRSPRGSRFSWRVDTFRTANFTLVAARVGSIAPDLLWLTAAALNLLFRNNPLEFYVTRSCLTDIRFRVLREFIVWR